MLAAITIAQLIVLANYELLSCIMTRFCFVLFKLFLNLVASVRVQPRKRNHSKHLIQIQCRELYQLRSQAENGEQTQQQQKDCHPRLEGQREDRWYQSPGARVTWQKLELWPYVQQELEPCMGYTQPRPGKPLCG